MTTKPSPTMPTEDLTVARVLVPLDGLPEAESALDTAAAVAERFDAPLALFCWHWGIGAEWTGRKYLEALRTRRQLDCELEAGWADAERAAGPLLQEAHRVPGTLVCMASHGRSGIGALANGSTTEDLIRQREPLLLVGPHMSPTVPRLDRPVMVTVDGSPMSESALPIASAWARRLEVPLEVVSWVEPSLVEEGHPWREDVVEAGYVERVAQRVDATMWETVHGTRPANALADYAAGHASMIVTSTHGRSGLARVVAGSVAIRIVRHAPCPVLLVRPRNIDEGPR
jgi:nucleotide-binding universal stress UspA family protein